MGPLRTLDQCLRSSKGLLTADYIQLPQPALVAEEGPPAHWSTLPCPYRDPGMSESLLDGKPFPAMRTRKQTTHEDTSGSSSQSPTSLTSFGCALKVVQVQRWLETGCISNTLGERIQAETLPPKPSTSVPTLKDLITILHWASRLP